MKHKAIILIALMATQYIYSQEAGRMRFTFVATPQISWIKSDNDMVDQKASRVGYNFGVIMDKFFGENYAFTTGITINSTGGKLNYQDDEENSYNQTYQLKYLEIPLGIKLRSADFRRMNIYGRFGLSPQINIQANDNDDKSISDEIRLFELGYHLGGGIEYAINSSNAIMFGILFNNGFTDVTKTENFDDKAILNRLVFEIGFIF
jgi:hypothetical protein